jgi:chromosomal replication initiator protein
LLEKKFLLSLIVGVKNFLPPAIMNEKFNPEWVYVTQNFKVRAADNIDISGFLVQEIMTSKAEIVEEEHSLVVYVKNKIFLNKLNQYRDLLEDCSFEVYKKRYKINFDILRLEEYKKIITNPEELPIFSDNLAQVTQGKNLETSIKESNLKKELTLDSYLTGTSNRIALGAAERVINSPGVSLNPFFLYGGSGQGKTHLVNSIGIEILKKFPNYKVLYVTFENFLNDFMDIFSFGGKKPLLEKGTFRKKYRAVDVLIIDDIQGISGKEGIENEFFNIFNELHKENKQIILTSDVHPSEFANLPERIKTRLSMGMIIDIEKPEYELRYRLIKSKASRDGLSLPHEAVDIIATSITSNFRELEGAYSKVRIFHELTKEIPSKESVLKALKDLKIAQPLEEISPRKIIDSICNFYAIKKDELKRDSRERRIAYPRQVCMYLLKKHTDLNYNEIASLLNKKDHTTIMHGVSKIEKDLEEKNEIKNQVASLKEIILKRN